MDAAVTSPSGMYGLRGGGPAATFDTSPRTVTFADRRPLVLYPLSAESLCRLVEGWVFREQVLRNGARQITDVLLPGDVIPASMLAPRSHGWETVACGEARILVYGRSSVLRSAALQRIRDRAIRAEVRSLRGRIVSLGRRDARARIAHLFCELHARLDRAGLVTRDGFGCPLTQEQIGDILGLTSVHVNRTLMQLRAEGLLLVGRPQVVIKDLDGLRHVAGFVADAACQLGADDYGTF